MSRNSAGTFEDNTVFRLNKDMFHELDKIYLGLSLFDVPDNVQDYIIVDVTSAVNKGQKTRVEFVSESMKTKIHVYKKHEAMITHEVEEDKSHQIELDTELNAKQQPYSSQHSIENGCSCQNFVCSCCRHLKVRKVRLDDVGESLTQNSDK
jgi:hypothetical protein